MYKESCNGCRLLSSPWLCRNEVCQAHYNQDSLEALELENKRFRDALEQISLRWRESGSLAAKHMATIAIRTLEGTKWKDWRLKKC